MRAGRGDPSLEPYASGSMLDFTITILLALLGMVLYLYLVTSDGASGGAPAQGNPPERGREGGRVKWLLPGA